MNQFAYLIFHLVIISSLVISKKLYPKMKLLTQKEFLGFIPVSIFFIIWDYLVTDIWWSFNLKYISFNSLVKDIKIPIEELAFFFVVPYALLVFVKNLFPIINQTDFRISDRYFKVLELVIKACLILSGFRFYALEFWYSFTICVLLFLTPLDIFKNKIYLIGLGFTLLMTLVFNFYLTYLPIVMYTQTYKTGFVIGTIPIEDFGYAIILYIWIVKGFHAKKNIDVFTAQKES
jgi:lycopene cyclase domain-containing protein